MIVRIGMLHEMEGGKVVYMDVFPEDEEEYEILLAAVSNLCKYDAGHIKKLYDKELEKWGWKIFIPILEINSNLRLPTFEENCIQT